MIEATTMTLINVLTFLALLGGLFFMFVGALGVVRLPDLYSRSHAASKCVTLGMIGMLLALVLFVGSAATVPTGAAQYEAAAEIDVESGAVAEQPTTAAVTKAVLVIVFFFIAAPVGSHMLARAAHRAAVATWSGTLSDELAEDAAESEVASRESRVASRED